MINFGDERLPPRFWDKVIPEPNSGCWFWIGGRTRVVKNYGSYGKYTKAGRSVPAHRASWEGLIGQIPAGLQIDHLCRVPECVNPAHLEPVTPQVNMQRSTSTAALRAYKAALTHCKHGHEYTPGNTALTKDGRRQCRTCRVERNRDITRNETAIRRALRMHSPRRTKAKARTHCKRGHEMSGENISLKLLRRNNRPTKELAIVICKTCKVEQAQKDYARKLARRAAQRVA